jgi:2-dehydro-3-deoxy-D-arabinonate dehydratase
MKIYRTKKGIIIEHEGNYYLSTKSDWDACINRANLFTTLLSEIKNLKADAALRKNY